MSGFGFTPENPENDPDKGRSENPFDFSNFGEIFNQFSNLGLNIQGLMASLSGQASPAQLSKEMIREISRKFLAAHGETPVSMAELNSIKEAMDIADLWINEATVFPPIAIPENCAISRRDWIDSTLGGWQELATPLVDGMTEAMAAMLRETSGEGEDSSSIPGMPGFTIPHTAITAIMGTFMGSLISSQLGQTIGNLAATVTGSNDVALPLTPQIRPQLIPQNVKRWSDGLEIDEREVRIYLALRELAAARLFAGAPWLRDYIKSAISTYGKGIRVDLTAMTEQAQNAIDAGELNPSDPESMTLALSGGLFTPEETPNQRAALENLEMVLALIEGWIDAVVTQSAGSRLPAIVRLREMQQRQRATNSPTQQLFASLVGLEVSPRRTREAIGFWEKVVSLTDIKNRDAIWDEAILLPRAEQLSDVEGFLKSRTVPDDLSGLI